MCLLLDCFSHSSCYQSNRLGFFLLSMCLSSFYYQIILELSKFYNISVNFFTAVFVLSSTLAFWSCLNPIFSRIPLGTYEYKFVIFLKLRFHCFCINFCLKIAYRFFKIRVHVKEVVLFIASMALVSCWTVYHKENFAWILLDILSFTLRYS